MHKQVVIPFRGWDLIGWLNEQGEALVAVRSIAEAIGVDWKTQHRRIVKDGRFRWEHMTTVGRDAKDRDMIVMPVEHIQGWLFTISPNKVKEEIRPKLLEFQNYCMRAIWMATSGQANQEVVAHLTRLVETLRDKVASLSEEVSELRGGHNEIISSAARVIRRGHAGPTTH